MSLIASNLSFKPGNEWHLDNVSFEMSKGQIYTILGRTLAGKTTLLKTLAGLISPDQGTLTLDDGDFGSIPVWKRQVALPQRGPSMNKSKSSPLKPLKRRCF